MDYLLVHEFLSFLTSATTRSPGGISAATAVGSPPAADDSSSSQREALLAAVRAQHAQIQAMIKATATPHPTRPQVAVMAVMAMVRLGVMAVLWLNW